MSGTSLDELRKAADAAIAANDWPAAAAGLRALLERTPGHPGLLVQLSYVESFLGQYRVAHRDALAAAAARPTGEQVASDVIARLRTFNEARALVDYVQRLGPPRQVPIPLLLAAAAQLAYLNDHARAMPLLDEARAADPHYPPTLLARAHVLMFLGRFDEARRDLQACMARAPNHPQLYWLLAQLGRPGATDNQVAAMRRLLANPALAPKDAASLGFALHRQLDELGEYEEAWQALAQACRVKRRLLGYDPADTRRLVDALVAMPAGPAGAAPTGARRVPIFIVGMHRSGTTLLEQLLDGHPDVEGSGELYDFTSQMREATDHHCKGPIDATIVERAGRLDYAAIGRGYLDGIEWRLGAARHFTDKLPSNFLNIGFICRALPQAKILHMVRDPVETCFSNLRELFSEANAYSYEQLELADFHLQYQRLMRHWHAAWPGRILDVDYAQLTRDPAGVLGEVARFCGLDFDPGMLDLASRSRGVATASAVQVRAGVVVRERPKWAPYAAHLQPLIHRLQSGASQEHVSQ
jgi:tetratricopeptide (TPR) repeat protein